MSAIGNAGTSSEVKIKEKYAKFVGGKVFFISYFLLQFKKRGDMKR